MKVEDFQQETLHRLRSLDSRLSIIEARVLDIDKRVTSFQVKKHGAVMGALLGVVEVVRHFLT